MIPLRTLRVRDAGPLLAIAIDVNRPPSAGDVVLRAVDASVAWIQVSGGAPPTRSSRVSPARPGPPIRPRAAGALRSPLASVCERVRALVRARERDASIVARESSSDIRLLARGATNERASGRHTEPSVAACERPYGISSG